MTRVTIANNLRVDVPTGNARFCGPRLRYSQEKTHKGEFVGQDTAASTNAPERASTALKSIRAKCLECSCGSVAEVRACGLSNCPLYRFRFGRNPNIGKREMSAAQREAARDRLAKAREGREVTA